MAAIGNISTPDGKRITDRDEIDRLNAVGMPPAYEKVWFCPHPNGHIQAVGYDDKGRKQYRYHPDFRERQEAAKYDRCAEFGKVLPKLRKRVEADLRKRKLARDTVVAAVVRLLDTGRIRVGNEAYVKDNKSYGATTLRSRHAKVLGRTVKMRFKAKSGIERELSITDRTLSRIVKQLPGPARPEPVPISGRATASRSRSARPTSTTISARRPARISPPSISAPGARA